MLAIPPNGAPPQPQEQLIQVISIPGTGYCLAAGTGIFFERDAASKTWSFFLGVIGGRETVIQGGFRPVRVKLMEFFKHTDEEMAEMLQAEELAQHGAPQ